MLPRISYLSTAAVDVIEYFKEETIDINPNIWFEYHGRPLKGHLPIGVLFDQCEDQTLPWRILLHFREFNTPQVVKLNSPEETSKYYFHSIKQAIHLIAGNTRIFTLLTIQQHNDLMNSIISVNATVHEEILSEVLSPTYLPRAIPLRIIIDGRPVLQRPVALYRSGIHGVFAQIGITSSRRLSNVSIDEDRNTLTNRLSVIETERDNTNNTNTNTNLIEESDSKPPQSATSSSLEQENQLKNSEPSSNVESSGAGVSTSVVEEEEQEDLGDENDLVTIQDVLDELFPGKSMSFLIHGVVLPSDAPVLDVWRKFAYPDLFLYAVVRELTSSR